MKQITLIQEDRVGLLSEISYILGKSNINIESLDVDIVGENALVTLLVRDSKRTIDVLNKNGFKTTSSESILIKIPNRPGAIHEFSKVLSNSHVNIETLNILSSDPESHVVVLKVDKRRKALKLLSDILLSSF
ncbi:MAG TPA: ACT domain-containing protein [Candidatus Bilamarchaeaceae archaeon]|nr:ACT domain-containing protein [Candidatus Bilamarchaeaceae archaeon]